MHVPLPPLRDSPTLDGRSWDDVLTAQLVLVAVPLSLWFVAAPLSFGLSVAALVGLGLVVRSHRGHLEYVHEECCTVLTLGDRVQITVASDPIES